MTVLHKPVEGRIRELGEQNAGSNAALTTMINRANLQVDALHTTMSGSAGWLRKAGMNA